MKDIEEREAFEKNYLGGRRLARRNEHGDYVLPSVQDAWAGWKARAAVEAAQRVPDVENLLLRQILALRIGGAGLYTDDGELQDNSVNPCIDFKRDSAELIHYKLKARLASSAPEAIK